jgi:hypothetical protein
VGDFSLNSSSNLEEAHPEQGKRFSRFVVLLIKSLQPLPFCSVSWANKKESNRQHKNTETRQARALPNFMDGCFS